MKTRPHVALHHASFPLRDMYVNWISFAVTASAMRVIWTLCWILMQRQLISVTTHSTLNTGTNVAYIQCILSSWLTLLERRCIYNRTPVSRELPYSMRVKRATFNSLRSDSIALRSRCESFTLRTGHGHLNDSSNCMVTVFLEHYERCDRSGDPLHRLLRGDLPRGFALSSSIDKLCDENKKSLCVWCWAHVSNASVGAHK